MHEAIELRSVEKKHNKASVNQFKSDSEKFFKFDSIWET